MNSAELKVISFANDVIATSEPKTPSSIPAIWLTGADITLYNAYSQDDTDLEPGNVDSSWYAFTGTVKGGKYTWSKSQQSNEKPTEGIYDIDSTDQSAYDATYDAVCDWLKAHISQ